MPDTAEKATSNSQAPACKSFYDIENQLRNCTCGTCPATPPLEDIDFRIKPPEDIDFAWIPTGQAPAWRERFIKDFTDGDEWEGFIEAKPSDVIGFIMKVESAAYQKGRDDREAELQGRNPY